MRTPTFLLLFWERLKNPVYSIPSSILFVITVIRFVAFGLLEELFFDKLIQGWTMAEFISYIPLILLVLILSWIAYKTKKNYWDDFSKQIEITLDSMNTRMMQIEKRAEKREVSIEEIQTATKLIANELNIVKFGDWGKFIDDFRKKLGLEAPSLPEDEYEVERIAGLLANYKNLVDVDKQWTFDDVKIVAGCLDSVHIGVEEERDKDKNWNNNFNKLLRLKRAYYDTRLDGIIDRHIVTSYVIASFTLYKTYSRVYEEDKYLFYLYKRFIAKTQDFERKYKDRMNDLTKTVLRRVALIKYFHDFDVQHKGKIK